MSGLGLFVFQTLTHSDVSADAVSQPWLISSLLPSGQDLLRILSQQDQQASGPQAGASPGAALPPAGANTVGPPGLPDQALAEEGEAREPVAAAAAHVVGESDGAATDGQDEELRDALAAETEHMVTATAQSC